MIAQLLIPPQAEYNFFAKCKNCGKEETVPDRDLKAINILEADEHFRRQGWTEVSTDKTFTLAEDYALCLECRPQGLPYR